MKIVDEMHRHSPKQDHPWPTLKEAKAQGCTCEWVFGGAIIVFDPACPILRKHKRDNS